MGLDNCPVAAADDGMGGDMAVEAESGGDVFKSSFNFCHFKSSSAPLSPTITSSGRGTSLGLVAEAFIIRGNVFFCVNYKGGAGGLSYC